MSDPSSGWEEYRAPKKKDDESKKFVGKESGGAVEMPGSARPPKRDFDEPMPGTVPGSSTYKPGAPPPSKPKAPAGDSDASFRAQRPGSVEEDAEVWDSKKGAWARPSGALVEGDEGYVNPAGEGAKDEVDEDTEVIVAKKKREAPTARAPIQPRSGGNPMMGRAGVDGRDFSEYTKPAAPTPPPAAAPSPGLSMSNFASLAGMGSSGTMTPGKPEPPRLYGQSSVPTPAPMASPAPTKPSQYFGLPEAPRAAAHAPPPTHNASPAGTTSPPMASAQVHTANLPQGLLNVLLVGSGAREHAMALAIRRSQRAHLFVVMKHRNPGLVKSASGFKILDDRDAAGIVAWARMQKIHLAVIGPESALESGVSDALRAAGIAVASPSQSAARIETSKTFMRDLMRRHKVPGQLGFHPFTSEAQALHFLDTHGPAWAVKPVGLTGGKGVQVYGEHFADVDGAKAYVRGIFAGRAGGGAVQFEEIATGEEFSLMCFTDGKTVLPMPAVQDHKRLRDGDQGPNTGGMGSYSQADGLLPFLSAQEYSDAVAIVQGLVHALAADGTPYVGTIYGQFMLTATGPKVIEVNARFGDPEAMNVLHILQSDYVELLAAMATGALAGRQAQFRAAATVVKYVVPRGYGDGNPMPGQPVQVDDFNIKRSGGMAYMGAIEQHMSGALATLSSRTLGVLGEGPTIEHANAVCEASLRHVHGEGLFVRHDIATPELLAKRVHHMMQVRGMAASHPFAGSR